jgi:methyl-accepting chemotaxis protein
MRKDLMMETNFDTQQALSMLATNVFYADKDFNLIFINDRGIQTLKSIEVELKKKFGLKAEEIQGQNIDVFHENPAHNRKILSNKNNFPFRSSVKLGNLVLDLNINATFNEKGAISGYVVNWEDISEKLRFEENAAIAQSMIEQMPINVMRADKNFNLVYMNNASKSTLKSIESTLPTTVEKMIGAPMDNLHKNPGRVKKILADPANLPHQAVIQIGGEKLDLLVSALTDNAGQYIGPMVSWSVVTTKLKLINDLTEASNQLSAAAEELLAVASSMSASAEETSAQSNTASAASEEISAGIQTVSTNMEEMTASIREITKNTNESSKKSTEALSMSSNANAVIQKLGESSSDIGNVIKVITSIAQQTNLLALNATIEAARAGEAGKGFAVVANEVKELAKQTATATEDISKKIEAIQNDSQSAVSSIGAVSDAIAQLNAIAGNIATAMEEQAATTNEVARVVVEATQGVVQITENIQQVSVAAEQTGKGANDMQSAARNLSDIASALTNLVEQVKKS